MGLFEETAGKVKEAFQAGEKKVNDVINIQKLKMDINNLNSRIEETYCAIGRAVWEKKDAPEYAAFGDEFKMIEDLKAQLAEIADRLAEAKGNKRCPDCGCFNSDGARFCNQCGKNI